MSTAIITEAKVPHYIDGQWVESNAREWSEIINPATGESLGKVPLSDAGEVTKAIDAAAAAYPAWRRTPPEDRIQPLFKLKQSARRARRRHQPPDHAGKRQDLHRSRSRDAPRHRERRSGLRHSDS